MGVLVLFLVGDSSSSKNLVEHHVQTAVVGYDARVRTEGLLDRYIYDARDDSLITNFNSFDTAKK